LKYYVGCRGWGNEKWSGEFYPPALDPKDYLAYYSKVFDLMELDLSGRGGGGNSYNKNNKLYDRLLFKKWAANTLMLSPTIQISIKLIKQSKEQVWHIL
jgi:hypothetical protein